MKEPSDKVLSEPQRGDASNRVLLERIAGALGMPVSDFYTRPCAEDATLSCSDLLAQFKRLDDHDKRTVANLISTLSRKV